MESSGYGEKFGFVTAAEMLELLMVSRQSSKYIFEVKHFLKCDGKHTRSIR
jgi:hypothetical protein